MSLGVNIVYKVIDLFSGVGGLSYGFRQTGFEIVVANEFDKEIALSYKENHKDTYMINDDITNLDLDATFSKYQNEVDVIIGGPPCQGFSQKGSRKTIHDERNYLFKSFVKVVELVKPRYFVMENVPNLLTAENGYFKDEIFTLFKGLGYKLDSAVLNAYEFGVPQNRRRAFILGKLSDSPVILPVPSDARTSVRMAISDLAFLKSGEGRNPQDYIKVPEFDYQKLMRIHSDKLWNHVATSHSKLALERLALIPAEKGKEVLPSEHLTKSIYSGTWSRIQWDQPSVTITTRFDTPSSGRFTHPVLDRAITVREAARLQSFPDHFIFHGSKGSQMKQVGNAVPPMLSKHIAEVILKDLITQVV